MEQACAQKVLPVGGGSADLTFGQWSRHFGWRGLCDAKRRGSWAKRCRGSDWEAVKRKRIDQAPRWEAKAVELPSLFRDGELLRYRRALEPLRTAT